MYVTGAWATVFVDPVALRNAVEKLIDRHKQGEQLPDTFAARSHFEHEAEAEPVTVEITVNDEAPGTWVVEYVELDGLFGYPRVCLESDHLDDSAQRRYVWIERGDSQETIVLTTDDESSLGEPGARAAMLQVISELTQQRFDRR